MIKLVLVALLALGAWALARATAWWTAKSLAKQSQPIEQPPMRAVTSDLARVAGMEDLTVHLLDSPIVNAVASPDGRIYLTKGLYGHFQSGNFTANEIASVIAHELGHVVMGHSKKRVYAVAGAHLLRLGFLAFLGRFSPALAVQAANFLSGMLMSRLSRQDEFEADAFATTVMLEAGYGAEPQISLLKKIDMLRPVGAGVQVSWLASHPPVEERVRAIEQHAAND